MARSGRATRDRATRTGVQQMTPNAMRCDEADEISPALDFWARPPDERLAAFARLRALDRPVFFEEQRIPLVRAGRGFHALVRHADVVHASRNAEGLQQRARGDLARTAAVDRDAPRPAHGQHGRPAPRAAAAGRRRVRSRRGGWPRSTSTSPRPPRRSSTTSWRAGSGDFVADVAGTPAHQGHLRHDGHPRAPPRQGRRPASTR